MKIFVLAVVLLALLRCLASSHSGPDWRSKIYSLNYLNSAVGSPLINKVYVFEKYCVRLRGGMNDSEDSGVSFRCVWHVAFFCISIPKIRPN